MSRRKMHLIGHLQTVPVLHHTGGWRHPDSDVDRLLDPSRYEHLARMYERGLFDGVLLVDFSYVAGLLPGNTSLQVQSGVQLTMLDPMIVLAQMARVTEHLGLSATMSTLLANPYQIARQFASLDHLSRGRAGWNIVTSNSPQEAFNFGLDSLPPKQDRYDHADEVVEACLALWNTWDEDALLVDKDTGRFADPAKLNYVDYGASG